MKKILQLLLASIVLLLVCISPLQQQHQTSTSNHSLNPYMAADNNFILASSFQITEKSKHTDFPEIPNFIFVLLLSLVVLTKLKPQIYSFIPLMKHLYLLYPIKYQSRYLVQGPSLI
jgi:hypothetical protein